MFYLTIILVLLGVLAWIGRRWWVLREGIRNLADAIQQRRPFLDDLPDLGRSVAGWRSLVKSANALVGEVEKLQELRAGQLAQLETTLGNLQEGVVVVDRDNYILLANNAIRTLFAVPGDPVGRRVETILKCADFFSYMQSVRTGDPGPDREMEFAGPNGALWLEAVGANVSRTSEKGGPWSLFVLHDVTRQRKLESIRREFVANVSHELKTPLSVINGYAETLAEDDGTMRPADRDRFIRTILRHTERLTAIVDDLLSLSRLESDHAVLRRATHDVADLLAAVIDEYGPRLESTGHRLESRIVKGSGSVEIDGVRLHQVFGNLLDNAQRHTPPGTTVRIGARAENGIGSVEIWVEDNGPGIPSEDLSRIFERFYRVEKGRSREKGGTGLGLSIVKHIIQLHGGRIWAESEGGRGTRIAFTLPFAPRRESPSEAVREHPTSTTAQLPGAGA